MLVEPAHGPEVLHVRELTLGQVPDQDRHQVLPFLHLQDLELDGRRHRQRVRDPDLLHPGVHALKGEPGDLGRHLFLEKGGTAIRSRCKGWCGGPCLDVPLSGAKSAPNFDGPSRGWSSVLGPA